MDNDQSLSEKFGDLATDVDVMWSELGKANGGNKASGRRFRVLCGSVQKAAKELRRMSNESPVHSGRKS